MPLRPCERYAFGRYLDLPAADLSRPIVVKRLDWMTRKGSPVMAAQTAAYGKAAYGWAIKRGSVASNPFANLPVAPTAKRERVLSDDELAAIWRATDGVGPFNAIVRFLILTGQRREEVAGVTWAEVSDDFSSWTIPASRAKNGATHLVPLSASAQDLLREAPRFGELVFPGLRGPFNGWSKAKAALDAKSGVTNWRQPRPACSGSGFASKSPSKFSIMSQAAGPGSSGYISVMTSRRKNAPHWRLGASTSRQLSKGGVGMTM
jgi:integrase